MIAATSIFTPVTYLPQRPSPLSPRSTNVLCLPFSPLMADAKKSSINVPFSKRPIKANPIMHTRDEMRERRRDLFLKRVQQDREEKRLEQRGDRVCVTLMETFSFIQLY
ncbi:hypothetical protein M501DRAFT_1001822 [Patellaria atrata CBS 101060]|uniref:Uncharacterized protein n=1 Tax=Patellaria atrata CBS 101060 TaxID=1346257 RepID=A0A9P4SEA9_9PEZI|nr:hypothetical protein M501DRAFT_1001822 [Patellaria atrata CBS 101060]